MLHSEHTKAYGYCNNHTYSTIHKKTPQSLPLHVQYIVMVYSRKNSATSPLWFSITELKFILGNFALKKFLKKSIDKCINLTIKSAEYFYCSTAKNHIAVVHASQGLQQPGSNGCTGLSSVLSIKLTGL